MAWELKSDRPIYIQLQDYIKLGILSGRYLPGDKLPSVRDLAEEAAVNPNTMQKALAELERLGMVYTQRTSGRFITEDVKMIEELKRSIAKEHITQFFEAMKKIGFSIQETIQMIEKEAKELKI